jgi:signal transduction histidine kinase
MLVVYAETQERHHPRFFIARGQVKPCPEVPHRAELAVADTGIGIAARDQTRVFERFGVRLENEVTLVGEGFGEEEA